jgi:hypothetical protein
MQFILLLSSTKNSLLSSGAFNLAILKFKKYSKLISKNIIKKQYQNQSKKLKDLINFLKINYNILLLVALLE